MIVAHVELMSAEGFSSAAIHHVAEFTDLDRATSEYERIANLLVQRGDRKNDLPKMLELVGDGQSVSLPLDKIHSVALHNYAKSNEIKAGTREAFPLLFPSRL